MSTIKTTVEHSPQQRHGGYEWPLVILALVIFAALVIVAYGNGYIHFGGQSGEVTRVISSTTGDGVTIADLDKVHDEIAPLFDRLTAVEKKIETIAPIVGEMTKLTTAVNAVVENVGGLATKADVAAVNTRVENVSAAVEVNRVAAEEKIARLQQQYEELKATLASNPEPAAPAAPATPVADEEVSTHPLDDDPEAMGPKPVFGDVGDEDFTKVVESSVVPNMNSFKIHVGPGGRKLKAIHKKDQCLPPRKLVRTDQCWSVGGTRMRCVLACK